MTVEEVKDICDRMWQLDMDCATISKVRDALEKQIPQKPIRLLRASENDYYDCPACHEYLWSEYRQNVCCHCGQAIDWSDENGD